MFTSAKPRRQRKDARFLSNGLDFIGLPMVDESEYLYSMDIVFKCPHCSTDLEVEAEAAGQQIDCPNCTKPLTIPVASDSSSGKPAAAGADSEPKAEKKMSVPFSNRPAETLIKKAAKPLEAAAKDGRPGMKVKTIRHSDCKEVGKDLFDSKVSEVLNELGESHIVSITPINYSYIDLGTQKLLTDFGVMIVYRG